MGDEKHRLLTLANTAALLLFTEHGNPPTLSLSQKVLAEHGANLLGAYKETVVEPAMTEIGIVAAEALQENCRLHALLAWIDEKPECRAAQFRALQDHNGRMGAAIKAECHRLEHDYNAADVTEARRALMAAAAS